MPPSTSLPALRASLPAVPLPARPHQFAFMASLVVGWAMIAGVHSTVWILAMSAALTSRARS